MPVAAAAVGVAGMAVLFRKETGRGMEECMAPRMLTITSMGMAVRHPRPVSDEAQASRESQSISRVKSTVSPSLYKPGDK